MNAAPLPSSLSTSISPPYFFTSVWTIDKPSPVPTPRSFRGKERRKDLRQQRGGDAGACIPNGDHDFLFFDFDPEHQSSLPIHRLHGIRNDINKDLQHLGGIRADGWHRLVIANDLHGITRRGKSSHFDGLIEKLGQPNRFRFRTGRSCIRREAVHN